MRKNTETAIQKVLAGKRWECSHHGNGSAIWTDGKSLFSYREPIAVQDPDLPGGWIVTNKKFSQTTTVQTNGVVFGLSHVHKCPVRFADHQVLKAIAY